MLRPSPALQGKTTQTIYSDDLFEERRNMDANVDVHGVSSTVNAEPSRKRKRREDDDGDIAFLQSELKKVKEAIQELTKRQQSMEYALV